MSNIFPAMKPYYDTVQPFPVAANEVIEVGDLIWDSSGNAKQASEQADQGTEALNQVEFATNFVGISASAHRDGDPAGTIQVRPAVLVKYPVASGTYAIGELLGADEAASGTALENQQLKKVTDLDAAIAVVWEAGTSVTEVWALVVSSKCGELGRRLRSTNGLAEDQTLADDTDLLFGTGEDAALLWSTGDADNHTTVLGLGDSNQSLHVTDKSARGTDWNVAANTHPTIYVHSNTTPITDYLRIGNHDGTSADIDVVGGTTLNLQIAGTTEALLTASILDLASVNLQMQDSGKVLDNNGNELINFPSAVSSAVNEITITNAPTGNNPNITASGETNVGFDIVTKGTGVFGVKADDTFAFQAEKDTNVKIGFFAATTVVQQATEGTTTGFTAGSGTAAKDDSTFTGNSGTKAYTVGDIVLALKNYGLLAAS